MEVNYNILATRYVLILSVELCLDIRWHVYVGSFIKWRRECPNSLSISSRDSSTLLVTTVPPCLALFPSRSVKKERNATDCVIVCF